VQAVFGKPLTHCPLPVSASIDKIIEFSFGTRARQLTQILDSDRELIPVHAVPVVC
jgi:hypothetical protein